MLVMNAPDAPPPLPPVLAVRSEGASDGEPCRANFSTNLLVIFLSLSLGLFLVDAFASLLDDALILFLGLHPLSAVRGLVALLAALNALGLYGLMGLTPRVPKRLFLPVALYQLAAILAVFPLAIYCFDRLQQFSLGLSALQVAVALWLLHRAQGGLKLRWPLVPAEPTEVRCFSWRNLWGFLLVNVFGLLPAVLVYCYGCTVLAVDHFSGGFMALHPGGLSVQVRTYVRDDGKTIELFPMSHVADAGFYQQVSRTFPTNSIILMEGVTDQENLLTNGISYQRMANTLGLAEQHESFKPDCGEIVPADVDVDQFSRETIDCLNLAMLVHVRGLRPEILTKLLQFTPSPQMLQQLFDDLLTRRNQHLITEIHSHLPQTDHLMIPWGVAHMPGIAREIQNSGFHLDQTQEYTVIRFHHPAQPPKE